mgnify:CR=1 FL=1
MAGPTSYQVVIYKVEPSREAKRLAFVYTRFKRKIVKWLAEKKPTLDDRELLDFIHKAWHKEIEKAGIPLALAFDLYRDCKNVYKSWLGQKRKKKPFPVVKKVSVILTHGVTYQLKEFTILGKRAKILGATNLSPEGKPAEARLVMKRGWYLHVTFEKETDRSFSFKGLVAVDINEDFIVVGNDRVVVQIPTRIDDAYHYVSLAQQLQKKYKKWRYVKAIIRRMRHFYRRARNILIDSARKIGKWVVDTAEMLNANVIVLEDLHGLIHKVSNIKKKYRARFMLMQYRRIQKWIEWQAEKRGLKTLTVPAAYTTFKCPKCGGWMHFISHRTLMCERCGFTENRDYVAVYNLYGRGLLHLSTAMSMKAGGEGSGMSRLNDYSPPPHSASQRHRTQKQ